jgi:hypothetical protein
MDALDHLIPLHLSGVFWSDGSGSNGRIRRGRGAHHGPRVPMRIPASAHCRRSLVAMQRLLVTAKGWTRGAGARGR